jgi:hypothetical protein
MKITGSDGRRYGSLGDALAVDVTRLIDEHATGIERAIRREYCSTHCQNPSVVRRMSNGEIRFEIEACCEDLRDRAEAAAARAS